MESNQQTSIKLGQDLLQRYSQAKSFRENERVHRVGKIQWKPRPEDQTIQREADVHVNKSILETLATENPIKST